MSNKLILFDIDRTLVKETIKTDDPWPKALEETFGKEFDLDIVRKSEGKTQKQIALAALKNNKLSENEKISRLDDFIKNLIKYYKTYLKSGKVNLFPNIVELLKILKKQGYMLGIVTGNVKDIGELKLKKAEIRGFFEFGVFGDDSIERDEIVKIALDKARKRGFEFKGDNAFVVGDTFHDICSAKNSNLIAIGVATGIFSKQELRDAGADYVLDNLEDIDEFLDIINKS
jgi:phosphoglycolate phosphatase-like HAD superfamily hydrolase